MPRFICKGQVWTAYGIGVCPDSGGSVKSGFEPEVKHEPHVFVSASTGNLYWCRGVWSMSESDWVEIWDD